MGKLLNLLQRLTFTVAVTAVSRALIARDRILGRLRSDLSPPEPRVSCCRHAIPSWNNLLDAMVARPGDRPAEAALLLCHGIGETVEHWLLVQRLLATKGVVSLVFDYSGYGRSSGLIGANQCEQDAIAAFRLLQQLFPSLPCSILGFSLGSGIAATIVSKVAVERLILCAAFTSLREAALCTGLPKCLSFLASNLWITDRSLRCCPVPVLVVHSEQDRLFPTRMAMRLRDACSSQCKLVVVPGLSHNEPFYNPQPAYWDLVVSHLVTERNSVQTVGKS